MSDLRALALAATPGPWEPWSDPDDVGDTQWCVSSPRFKDGAQAIIGSTSTNGEADAAYIAAASPDVVLALLDALAALVRQTSGSPASDTRAWDDAYRLAFPERAHP